ncbi:polysaccharide pyruvyl transferase family protein [Paenibacillus sp. GCM10023250]|uniref:polysaccharide pyruvyl transferase family protein n=1 Tax=Paenibacillus sp. GCM10023250 TaxID=3252648 RepID=UPI00360A9B62
MKILIINAHSSKNKGDAGILLSMIDSLKKNNPGCEIRIKSRFPEVDKNAYDIPVSACIHNVSVSPNISKLQKVRNAFKLVSMIRGPKNNKDDPDYLWADVVVSCGGGFLLSHGFSVALLQHLAQIKAAIDLGKPVIIYSQSIGPFYNKFMQNVTRDILNKVTKIYIRETVSQSWLQKIGCNENLIEVVPDSAFCMMEEESKTINKLLAKIKSQHKGPLIGVTVRDWNFPELKDKDEQRKSYVNSIRALINFLTAKIDAKLIFMPQVLGPNPFNDDRIISREILAGINPKQAELLDLDLSPRELKYFYSKMDMFVGTRMHSNIFALSSNIPTVAINYEHKTRGIMNMLGLNEYVIEINTIKPDELMAVSDKCWKNKAEIKRHLESKIPQIISDAEIPSKIIQSYLVIS